MPIRPLASRLSVVLTATALVGGPTAAERDPLREIAGTGTAVAGLGRLGSFAAYPAGIDDEGRVLVHATLADGTEVLLWAAAEERTVIARHRGAIDVAAPSLQYTAVSRDGRHLVALDTPTDEDGSVHAHRLYAVTSTPSRLLLAAGDRTLDGVVITGIQHVQAIANDGAILLTAHLDAPDAADTNPTYGILRLDDGGARTLASTSTEAPAAIRFIRVTAVGFAPDGAAIVSGCRDTATGARCGIFGTDGTHATPLLTSGDRGVDGLPIGDAEAWAVASNGHILARTFPVGDYTPGPVVRLADGQLFPVRRPGEPLVDGSRFDISGGTLNARGDVMLTGQVGGGSDEPEAQTYSGTLLYPVDQPPRLLEDVYGFALNDRGEIAASSTSTVAPEHLGRWSEGHLETLLSANHRIDGQLIRAGGLAAACLAEDGRVAALATADHDGWICADRTGPHLAAAVPNDETPYRGYTVQCAFAGDELVTLYDGTVTRTDDDGARPVLSIGDHLVDGTVVGELRRVSVNAAGTLTVLATEGDRRSVIVQDRDGIPRRVPVAAGDGFSSSLIVDAGIADDGTIVAIAGGGPQGLALVAVRDTGTTVLSDEAVFADELTFEQVAVRGRFALLTTSENRDGPPRRYFLFDLDAGTSTEVLQASSVSPPGANLRVIALDLSSAGDVLFSTVGRTAISSPRIYWRLANGNLERLLAVDSPWDEIDAPFRLNAIGNVLFASTGATDTRARLSMSGPAPQRACPAAAASTTTTGGGCQLDARPPARNWPVLVLLLAIVAARRRVPTGTA